MLALLFALLAPTLSPADDFPPVVDISPADTADIVYVVAPQENEARYRVREQLARLNFPNDAVGATSAISGRFVLMADGTIDGEASAIMIDLSTMATDSDRRDNYVRRNTFETEDHPTATLVPTRFGDLPDPLLDSGEANFTLEADFIFKGERHSTLWDVTARFENGAIRGLARTVLTFEQINLTKPSVGSVLSVADEIRLEYDFFLVNEALIPGG